MTTTNLRRLRAGILLVTLAAFGLLAARTSTAQPLPKDHWVATWTMSPMPANALPDGENTGFANQTLRETAHISIGGHRVRVRLSNAYGGAPLAVGAVHLALFASGSAIVPGTDHALTFHGSPSVVIPAGAPILSDAIEMDVAPFATLAVSIYLPQATGPLTWHQLGTQTTYISAAGDATAAPSLPGAATSASLYLLAGIDVTAPAGTGAVVALGDSITDGYASTPDAFHRWPDDLARRISGPGSHTAMAVLNQGISGNRLLHDVIGPNALARFDRDVLAEPGVTHIIVLEGINDIGLPSIFHTPAESVGAADLIAALTQLIERAHAKGIRILGATLTPFENSGEPYYSPAGEATRQALNNWIRSGAKFDGVLDFDLALRNPSHPTQLSPAFDSGDHLHPNDAGYAAMAAAIDLKLLAATPSR